MAIIRNVCVYCGSSAGTDPVHVEAAQELGRAFAAAGIRLVYGGGSIGLMGTIARSVMEHGGRVTGVIPRFLVDRELMLRNVDDLVVTRDMHERKRLMFERSEAFVAMPGGIGTLEELIEMMTWAQLGQHAKPILLANFSGFWDPLIALLDHMSVQGFLRNGSAQDLLIAGHPEEVVPLLESAAAQVSEADLAGSADIGERM